jgi:ribosome recycling factor
VEAYGAQTPLNQVGSIGAPEARLLVVQPWDKSLLAAIERAIRASDLGLNPSNDGQIIRVPIPALTEERRKELVKLTDQKIKDLDEILSSKETEILKT